VRFEARGPCGQLVDLAAGGEDLVEMGVEDRLQATTFGTPREPLEPTA
jgi:hypothetical protein